MSIFKVEAQGDTLYVEAEDLQSACSKFTECIGVVPTSLCVWQQVDELPDGEEAI